MKYWLIFKNFSLAHGSKYVIKRSLKRCFVQWVHVETERQKVLYSKHFVTSQKRPYHVTFELDFDREHILEVGCNGDNRVQVWWRSSHVCGRSSDLRVKVYRRTTDALRLHKLIPMEWAKNYVSQLLLPTYCVKVCLTFLIHSVYAKHTAYLY